MSTKFLQNIIVSDTSCLIALTNIKRLELLKELARSVVITPEVAAEYGLPLPEWILIKSVADVSKTERHKTKLHIGEASSIALAEELRNVLLVLDDAEARKYAVKFGFNITGTLGILMLAHRQGLIQNLATEIEKLRAINFWLPRDVDTLIR